MQERMDHVKETMDILGLNVADLQTGVVRIVYETKKDLAGINSHQSASKHEKQNGATSKYRGWNLRSPDGTTKDQCFKWMTSMNQHGQPETLEVRA